MAQGQGQEQGLRFILFLRSTIQPRPRTTSLASPQSGIFGILEWAIMPNSQIVQIKWTKSMVNIHTNLTILNLFNRYLYQLHMQDIHATLLHTNSTELLKIMLLHVFPTHQYHITCCNILKDCTILKGWQFKRRDSASLSRNDLAIGRSMRTRW